MNFTSLKPVVAIAALIALAALRTARLVIGAIGLQHELGMAWALLAAACLILFRFTLPIRIGAFLGLMSLWHWPWYAALVFAAPRLILVLPGLASTTLAHWRHPRAVWRGVPQA
jgi:hypothetical protein